MTFVDLCHDFSHCDKIIFPAFTLLLTKLIKSLMNFIELEILQDCQKLTKFTLVCKKKLHTNSSKIFIKRNPHFYILPCPPPQKKVGEFHTREVSFSNVSTESYASSRFKQRTRSKRLDYSM